VIARTARRGPIVARFARDPAVLSARIAPPATRGRRATRERDAVSRDAGANETETVRRASSSPFGRAFVARRHRDVVETSVDGRSVRGVRVLCP
jgi:hypothetical protein